MSRANAHVVKSNYGPGFDASLHMCSTPLVGHSIPRMSLIAQVSESQFCYTNTAGPDVPYLLFMCCFLHLLCVVDITAGYM